MRVQIPDRGIRSPDGGNRHRGIFRKAKRARETSRDFSVGNSKGKAGANDTGGDFR